MLENEKNVPKRRFKGFENAEAWEKCEFERVFSHVQNNALSRAKLNYESGYAMNVHYGDVLIKFEEYLDVKKAELPMILDENVVTKYKASFLKNGDIIITDAAEDETVGKCCEIIGIEDEKVLSGLHTIPCRPNWKFESGYLGYYMNSSSYHDQLLPLMQGTKVNSISKAALKNTDVNYPKNNEEQAKIGTFFKQLDTLITLHQRKLEKMKALKIAYLTQMFPAEGESKSKLRFAGFDDDWEQRKLGKIGETYSGLSGKTKEDFGHGSGKYITYMNVFLNEVSNTKMVEKVEIDKKQNQVKAGDVFFTTSSETPEEVGMSSVLMESIENMYLNSFCFGYRPYENFDNYYLAYMLRSPSIRKKIKLLAQGISRYNISKNKVMEIDITIPNQLEQYKIGCFFNNIDNLITLHQRKLEKLQDIKKAYLNEMFI